MRRAKTVAEQLQHALNSRVMIEQAKGSLSQHAGISASEAFGVLRTHARNNGMRLTELARGVVDGTVDLATFTGQPS